MTVSYLTEPYPTAFPNSCRRMRSSCNDCFTNGDNEASDIEQHYDILSDIIFIFRT